MEVRPGLADLRAEGLNTAPMQRDDWHCMMDVFQRAIELGAGERTAFLDRACAGDADARNRAERLLDAHRRPLPWLDGSVFEAVPDLLDAEPPATVAGRRIGPFELLRELGQGGMGAVYLAQRADDQYHQQVAIKLIRGDMVTRQEERRFRQERQILASLEHPNIARLLGGDVTPEGLPYLVMEYIEGEPLEAWCRRLGPSLETRLELLRQVCCAVQYAHSHMVVHCDLKPSNVLVSDNGVPKLLDFGIARLLGHDFVPSLATTTVADHWRMTPDFASPEQVRGERLTAASDIYSLGVMLYRLLAGCPPYRLEGRSLHQIQRVICEQEPEPPSVAVARPAAEAQTADGPPGPPPGNPRRRLAGDLDNIVSMALRKDPARRYASAQQLSEDLRRHLTGLPVTARQDTLFYRSGKFVRRHRLGLAATGMVGLALVAGIWTANVERARAEDARARAQVERSRAESVASFLTGLFQDADNAGEISIGALFAQPGARAARELLLDEGARRVPVELSHQPDLQADLMQRIGDAYRNLGNYDQAEGQLNGALDIRRRTFGDSSLEVAASLDSVCMLRLGQGDLGRAEARCRESLEIRRGVLPPAPLLVAESLNSLALVLRAQERLDDAEGLLREALELRRRHLPERHQRVTTVLNNLAVLLQQKKSYAEAEALFRDVLARKLERYGTEHLQVVNSRNNLASLLQDLGRGLRDAQRYDEAEALYRQALASGRTQSGDGHPLVATVHFNLGTLLMNVGRNTEATRSLEAALDIDRRLFGEEHPDVARDLNGLAVAAYHQGSPEEAAAYLRRALEIYRRTFGAGHPRFRGVLFSLTTLWFEEGRDAEAQELLRSALETWRRVPATEAWVPPRAAALLGGSLLRDGRLDDAEPLLRQGYRGQCAELGPRHDFTRQALSHLIDFHTARNDSAGAERLSRLLESDPARCSADS